MNNGAGAGAGRWAGEPVAAEAPHAGRGMPPGPEDRGPQVPHVPWTIPEAVAVFFVGFLGAFLLTFLAGAVVPSGLLVPASLAAFFVSLGGTTLLFVRLRYPGYARGLFGARPPRLADIGAGLAYGVAAYLVINVGLALLLTALAQLLGYELPAIQEGLREGVTDEVTGPYVVASAVILAPFAEELYFRGMLFQALRNRLRLWAAAGLSSLAFAVAHVQATWEATGLVAVAILPLGVFLAWAFHRRASLAVAIVIHAVFNGVGTAGILGLG